MTDVEQAAGPLDVDAKFFQPFDVNEPFNDDARLEGFMRPSCGWVTDHRYAMP